MTRLQDRADPDYLPVQGTWRPAHWRCPHTCLGGKVTLTMSCSSSEAFCKVSQLHLKLLHLSFFFSFRVKHLLI